MVGSFGVTRDTLLLSLSVGCLLLPAGCRQILGIEDGTATAEDAAPPADSASPPDSPRLPLPNHQFAVSELQIPRSADEANQLALDLDESGQAKNALGHALASMFIDNNVEVQRPNDGAISRGEVIPLINVQAPGLLEADEARAWFLRGSDPDPPPCEPGAPDPVCGLHLEGGGTFEAEPASEPLVGSIANGIFEGGPAPLHLEIVLVEGHAPLPLDLAGARMRLLINEDGIAQGSILAGGIPTEQVQTILLPELHLLLVAIVEEDCQQGGATPEECCDAGSTGESILGLFDTDNDCQVSLEEFTENGIIQSLFSPDLDLFDHNGEFNPNTGGENDTLSAGFGLTGVAATFPPPSDAL